MYDDAGVQYLDCVNGTSHVGHCHPQVKFFILYYLFLTLLHYIVQVVAAAHRQMSRLVTSQGLTSDLLSRFVTSLM